MDRWLIGIPTYKRPVELDRLLRSVYSQSEQAPVTVLVVDNDPSGSAKQTCDLWSSHLTIKYGTETRVGVVHVRNRILDEAQRFDYLAFLDDDQEIPTGWLGNALKAVRKYPNSVIAGPVEYQLEKTDAPSELIEISLGRPERPEGDNLSATGTGNSIIPISELPNELRQLGFSNEFSTLGGEDTDYYRRITDQGFPIRWCADLAVQEHVPADRATRRALQIRMQRSGAVNSKLSRSNALTNILGYILRLTIGSVLRLVGINPRARARGEALFHSGIGGLRQIFRKGSNYYG